MLTLPELRMALATVLHTLSETYFVPEMKLTLVCRLPGNDEADIVTSDDDLAEVQKAIARRMGPGTTRIG